MKTFFHSISFAIHFVNCQNTTYGQTTGRNFVNFGSDKSAHGTVNNEWTSERTNEWHDQWLNAKCKKTSSQSKNQPNHRTAHSQHSHQT